MSSEKKNILLYSFTGLIIFSLITFSGVKNSDRKVEGIEVTIAQDDGNFFTDQMEVLSLMTIDASDFIVGSELSDLDPKALEIRIEKNPFIRDAQVYRDLKGNLKVTVEQNRPIARVLMDGAEDKYIDVDGNILPVNAKHTARVPLLETTFEFGWKENLNESDYGSKVFELLNYVKGDEFWQAQIAQIIVLKNGDVELLPQVTKQKIAFGKPEDLEKKFARLMIFYKEILPKKGWNTYSLVNLKYDNQIICE
ncbi:MAG: cell division protein FtsQ [Cyclobacteriaceae bacterium]